MAYDANDGFSAARGNQKEVFVGTGAQINALSTTYVGQPAYCTSTGSGFTIDVLYERNAANSAWNAVTTYTTVRTETAEANTTQVTDNADFTTSGGNQYDRYYAFFTLPTTEKLYIITKIEWKNGATVAGNIASGIDLVDANPPTINSTPLVAMGQTIAQSGTSTTQSTAIVGSAPIRAGAILGAWISSDNTTSTLREQTGLGSQNQYKALAAAQDTPNAGDNTAWSTATARKYIKIYYRGYV